MSLAAKGWIFRIAFFLLCPLLLSLPLGLFQAGFAQHLTLEVSVLFWAVAWLSTWWVSEAFLRILHAILRPWRVPLIVEIVLANICAIIAASVYFPPIMFVFAEHAAQLPPASFNDRLVVGSVEHILTLIRSGLSGLIAWVSLRSLYAMLPDGSRGKVSRLGLHEVNSQNQRPTAVEAPAQSQNMSKFRRELASKGVSDLGKVIAVQASDHYVNVYLDDGRTELILSRFSDAVKELSARDGLRVHRSFWINRNAILRIERDGPTLTAHLTNTLSCPVSTKYQGYFEHFLARADCSPAD